MIAKKIRSIPGFTGEAWLYELTPPFGPHQFVISSAANVLFSGPETYVFPASEAGEVTSWSELEGSFRGGLNCDQAIRNMGYEVSR